MTLAGGAERLPLSDFANQKVRRNDPARLRFNIMVNSARGLAWVRDQLPANDHTAIFVGNAPSLKSCIPAIRKRQKKGASVWAVNGAHDYLISKGIIPEFAGFCDPAERMVDVVQRLNDKTAYLVASCCSPRFFDHLAGRNVTLWHMNNEYDEEPLVDVLGRKYGKAGTVFSGGSTCILRLPAIAYFKGVRRMHFYGVDSSFSGKSHVDRDDTDLFGKIFEVECAGRTFRTNVPLARQTEEFCVLADLLGQCGCDIRVHGEGLLPFRARQARIK